MLKRMVGIDIETTGLKQEDGHRIIEICMIKYNTKMLGVPESKYIARIDPRRAIDAKAQLIHGISLGQLVGKPMFKDMAHEIGKFLSNADIIIAHNMDFDGTFLAAELMRVGESVPDVKSFCTMENARWASATGKKPSLKELCFACGIEYDTSKAHAAEYDVQVMMECFFYARDRGFYKEFDEVIK